MMTGLIFFLAVTLAWNDNSADELGFVIERSNGTTFAEVARVGANVTEWTDSAPSAVASYRVAAYNEVGLSGYSNVLQVTTAAPRLTFAGTREALTVSVPSGGAVQWYRNGLPITGATNAQLSIPRRATGTYYAVVDGSKSETVRFSTTTVVSNPDIIITRK